jgi:hypothetical protein
VGAVAVVRMVVQMIIVRV